MGNETDKREERRTRSVNPTPHYGLGKLPPQAIDIEEAVLGAIMLERDAILQIIDKLAVDFFYKDSHQKIFAAILRLYTRSNPIDILTVTAELRASGELEMVGGAYIITELTDRVASAANIEYHSRIVHQKFLQREMIRVSTDTIQKAYEDTTEVFDMIDEHQTSIAAMMSSIHGAAVQDVSDLVVEEVMELYKPPIEGLVGVGSGFTSLDTITNGFREPDLIIIAARPAMGKTAFMLNCARNASVDFQKPGIIFSLEMSSKQLVQRLISAETSIPIDKIIKRNLNINEADMLQSATEKLQIGKQLFIDDTAALPILELRAKAKRSFIKDNIKWVMVDYLQLMKGLGAGKNGNREQEIASISAGLKALAKELKIPVIALSQLSRAVESRPGGSKRPMLSDLRESGAIEQDADVVMFLYRPEYYGLEVDEDNMPTAGIGEVIIAKNRNGACDKIRLMCNLSIMKFKNLDISDDLTPFEKPNNYIIRPSNMGDNPYSRSMEDDDDTPF